MLPLVVVQIEKVLCRKIKLARSRKRQARQKKHYLSVFQTHRRILIQKNRPILRRKSQTIRVRAVIRRRVPPGTNILPGSKRRPATQETKKNRAFLRSFLFCP